MYINIYVYIYIIIIIIITIIYKYVIIHILPSRIDKGSPGGALYLGTCIHNYNTCNDIS